MIDRRDSRFRSAHIATCSSISYRFILFKGLSYAISSCQHLSIALLLSRTCPPFPPSKFPAVFAHQSTIIYLLSTRTRIFLRMHSLPCLLPTVSLWDQAMTLRPLPLTCLRSPQTCASLTQSIPSHDTLVP